MVLLAHFGVRILANSTVEALLIPLFGQFLEISFSETRPSVPCIAVTTTGRPREARKIVKLYYVRVDLYQAKKQKLA